MNSEIFHLVFNNFKSNISSNWSELREESQFCDVTLACEGSRVEAHKVILSSCSPVIKDLLIQTNHPHPLVYLRGVKSMQIKALLDFIYKGEVDIAREDLDDFLEVARELKVKGLAEDDKQSKECSSIAKAQVNLVHGKFGNNEDHTPGKMKPEDPTMVFPSIVKDEYEVENEKNVEPYYEPSGGLSYEPHIKMWEEDYYGGEDMNDGAMNYKCEFCEEIVSRIGDDYKNHLSKVHMFKERRDLGCPDCFEKKEDYMAVKRCQQRHKNDKSWNPPTEFECKDGDCAGVGFKQKKAFLQHLRRHHGMDFKPTIKPDNWVCMYCEKLYASVRSLRAHEKICPHNPSNINRMVKPAGRPPKPKEVMEIGHTEEVKERPPPLQETENQIYSNQFSAETFGSSSGMMYPSGFNRGLYSYSNLKSGPTSNLGKSEI